MYYIIKVSSDGDFGALSFRESKMSIESIFNSLKENKMKDVIFYEGTEDEFYVAIDYKSKIEITEDFLFHIKNNWMDYDDLKATDYFLWKDDK